MCAPLVVGAVVAGTAISAYSQYKQGQSAAKEADFNAQQAEYQRRDAIQQGAYKAGEILKEGRRVAASGRTIAAASGVAGGSVDNMFASSAINAAVDAERTKANAARSAWGFASQEADLRAQAKTNRKAGILGAIGTGLSGVGAVASTYRAMSSSPKGP